MSLCGTLYTEVDSQAADMPDQTKIARVILRNYKSFRECDVSLGPITFLVGPNGAGKSNFVEALRFVSDALSSSLERALDTRSGFRSIIHRGANQESVISFELHLRLGEGKTARYLVQIGAVEDGPVSIVREECIVEGSAGEEWFRVRHGKVESNQGVTPAASEEKLYLVNASGLAAFEPVYRALSSIAVYNPVPDEIRGFKTEKRYRTLDRNGSALAETIFKLKRSSPERMARVTDYLRRINSSLLDVDAISVDANYDLRFHSDGGIGVTEEFPSQNASDGTLRALAVLVALFQERDRYPLTITGLEEPEAGLHPAAAGVLFDSLMESSHAGQIVVTSYSPDLLDRDDIPEDAIRAVAMSGGRTIIGPINGVARSALKERLYTAGELMRMDQLQPEGAPEYAPNAG
ncbi:MAG: AAA family ATPase [Bryobacteraceae bacterium]